jgi:hypothetical protein
MYTQLYQAVFLLSIFRQIFCKNFMTAGTAQSVQQIAIGWAARGSIIDRGSNSYLHLAQGDSGA